MMRSLIFILSLCLSSVSWAGSQLSSKKELSLIPTIPTLTYYHFSELKEPEQILYLEALSEVVEEVEAEQDRSELLNAAAWIWELLLIPRSRANTSAHTPDETTDSQGALGSLPKLDSKRCGLGKKDSKCDNLPKATKSEGDFCFKAGLPSTYNQRGKCKRVESLQIGSMTLSCEEGKTLCNPLLYGLKQDQKALCVPKGKGMKACREKGKELGLSTKHVARFWNMQPNSDGPNSTAEDFNAQDVSDLWSQQHAVLTQRCEDPSDRQTCRKCAKIGHRLARLSRLAKCSDSCGFTPGDSCRGRGSQSPSSGSQM